MKPRPWAQPKIIVSVSNPGASQKTISAGEDRQLDPGEPLYPGEEPPGHGPAHQAAGGERGEDDPLLLASVGDGVALARAGAGRAADVAQLDALRDDLRKPPRHHLPSNPCCAAPPVSTPTPSGSDRRRSARSAAPWRTGREARRGRWRRSRQRSRRSLASMSKYTLPVQRTSRSTFSRRPSPVGSSRMKWNCAFRQLLRRRGRAIQSQQTLGSEDDERARLADQRLAPQQVEVLRGGAGVGDPDVALGGEREEALDAGARVLRARSPHSHVAAAG